MYQKKSIAIIGWEEGTAGQVDSWLGSIGYSVDLFIHPSDDPPQVQKIIRAVKYFDYPEENSFKNKPLVSKKDWADLVTDNFIGCLVTLSAPYKREEQIDYAKSNNINLINAIHPSAIINSETTLGTNIIMQAGTIVGYRSEINDGVFLNTGSQIDHHNFIDKFVTINPGVITAGNVRIGKYSIVHTGATVINKITIGDNALIAAGAVVIKDVQTNTKVAGVPASLI